jgi:hypothetical protein
MLMKRILNTILLLIAVYALYIVSLSFLEEEKNPFTIGDTVSPVEGAPFTGFSDESFASFKNDGAMVVDLTNEFVRVCLEDGSEDTYYWKWLEKKDELVLTRDWVIGNPYSPGQEVCAIPSSLAESFPDKGIVEAIDGDQLQVEGFDRLIDWGHFQECN